jgi:phage pi2 protein 07
MAKEKQEYDYEGDMAMSQLKSVIANAQRIHDMLERDTNIPEWVQSKITLAEDYISTAANYMQGEMKEETIDKGLEDELMSQRQGQSGKNWRVTRANKTIGTYNSKDKADVKAMKHPLNKVIANEEVTHSVHVKTYDSHGQKQMNSPEFKKHVTAHGGELDYPSDKGAAFKFKSASHAAAFHRGVQSKFRELDSEHDMHEDVAMGTGPVNVAANVADPKNKRLFDKPMKRFKSFKAK